jgi:hypothetical protein
VSERTHHICYLCMCRYDHAEVVSTPVRSISLMLIEQVRERERERLADRQSDKQRRLLTRQAGRQGEREGEIAGRLPSADAGTDGSLPVGERKRERDGGRERDR